MAAHTSGLAKAGVIAHAIVRSRVAAEGAAAGPPTALQMGGATASASPWRCELQVHCAAGSIWSRAQLSSYSSLKRQRALERRGGGEATPDIHALACNGVWGNPLEAPRSKRSSQKRAFSRQHSRVCCSRQCAQRRAAAASCSSDRSLNRQKTTRTHLLLAERDVSSPAQSNYACRR